MDTLEFTRQLLFLSRILAGFAVTVAIELIALGRKNRIATLALAAFIVSSAASLTATSGYVIVLTAAAGAPGAATLSNGTLVSAAVPFGFLCGLGLIAFLVGRGLSSWLHSRTVGLVSTVTVALSLLAILAVGFRLAPSGGH
jgi:hypothetical protein